MTNRQPFGIWMAAEGIHVSDPRHPQYQPPHVCGSECEHNAANTAGLAIRQQRRIETREELRRRTRREVAEEIAAWADDLAAGVINRDKPYNRGFIHASETLARHAREIATKEATTPPPPPPATDGCASTHPMASHIPCRKAAGHPGDHESRNGRNWRPREDGAR